MIIESPQEFTDFMELYKNNSVIIIPILCDLKRHAINNKLSFLFIKLLGLNQYYILPFNHNECLNLDYTKLQELSTDNTKYVFDKKNAMHCLPFNNMVDINVLYYLNSNSVYEFDSLVQSPLSHLLIERMFDDVKNINRALPILKFYEKLVCVSDKLEEIINDNKSSEDEPAYTFLNNNTIESLQKIEKEGLFVDKSCMLNYFPHAKNHIDDNNLIYTEYNIYTATGRPANRFGNINFAALNKDNGERACFKSRFGENGKLIMFDYDAYHLRLMADMVGYQFEEGQNVHEYLGKMYFGKETLTEEEYNESKGVSFRLLYGGIDKTIADAIPFFGKVKSFIDTMWQDAQSIGYAETLISKKKIKISNFESLNKNKLFNYILQNYETEQNIHTITGIYSLLSTMQSKLVLYLYDGFLFDVSPLDIDIESQLKGVLSRQSKFPVKVYAGKDFHNLVKI